MFKITSAFVSEPKQTTETQYGILCFLYRITRWALLNHA
jgi:hypothetical protein